jgi:hypothetical protein
MTKSAKYFTNCSYISQQLLFRIILIYWLANPCMDTTILYSREYGGHRRVLRNILGVETHSLWIHVVRDIIIYNFRLTVTYETMRRCLAFERMLTDSTLLNCEFLTITAKSPRWTERQYGRRNCVFVLRSVQEWSMSLPKLIETSYTNAECDWPDSPCLNPLHTQHRGLQEIWGYATRGSCLVWETNLFLYLG